MIASIAASIIKNLGAWSISVLCGKRSDAPLYFISTHGFYDMNKYTTGTPYLTTVPENTIVIETSTIGNYCLFINIRIFINKNRYG